MQTSSIDDTAHYYQEMENYGTVSNIQNNPVITKRHRENKTNDREHYISRSDAAEHSKVMIMTCRQDQSQVLQ